MRDHADKEVPCLPPKALPKDAPWKVRHAASWATLSGLGYLWRSVALCGLVVLPIVALQAGSPTAAGLWRAFQELGPAIAVGAVAMWLASPLIWFWRGLMVRGWCLERAICPSCGYDLSTVPADPATGLRTCPECAAVWMVSVDAAKAP